jgi:hypothetical protein
MWNSERGRREVENNFMTPHDSEANGKRMKALEA